MKKFASGAIRSELAPRYDLIPREGLRRLALRYTMGATKYGEYNWQKGLKDVEFIKQARCHIMEHFLLYLEQGNEQDDNLAAIMWGCCTLMESEKTNADDGRSTAGDAAGDQPARPVPQGPRKSLPAAGRGARRSRKGTGRGNAKTEAWPEY